MGKKASEEHYRAFLYMVNEQMKEKDANASAQLEIKYISEKQAYQKTLEDLTFDLNAEKENISKA